MATRKTEKLIVTDKIAKELAEKVENRAPNKAGLHGLTKLEKRDLEYLGGMWEVFKAGIESKPILDEYPKRTGVGHENSGRQYRYTPLEMWNNIKKYFEVTIAYGQPLTVGGIAVFNGMSQRDLMNPDELKKYPEEYDFLRKCAKFVEMYNEYAAHRKQNPAGPIFILKNFGWKDTQTHEVNAVGGALTEDERTAAQQRIANLTEEKK